MKLTYKGQFNVAGLMDELLTAFPAWLYIEKGEQRCALGFQSKADSSEVYLDVPENSNVTAIETVIAAHNPNQLSQAQQVAADRAALVDSLRKPWDQWTATDQANFIRIMAEQAGVLPQG